MAAHPRFITSATAVLVALVVPLLFVPLAPGPLYAAGGGGGGGGGASVPFTKGRTTDAQRAISEFKDGEKKIKRAHKLEVERVEALATGNQKKVAKLDEKRLKLYSRAERDYKKALRYDESLFQAWSALGYTRRKLGRYPEALEAYDRAIELEPRFAEAVEYRAEAYLELGRLDEAKIEYMRLYPNLRPLADMLMLKMQTWVAERTADPGEIEPERIASFSAWIDERVEEYGPPADAPPDVRATW